MNKISNRLHLRWTQAGLSASEADLAQRTGNQLTVAEAEETLAIDEASIGLNQSAVTDLRRAYESLSRLGITRASDTFRAEWKVNEAKIDEARYGPQMTLEKLRADENLFAQIDAFQSKISFYSELARLLHKTEHHRESLSYAESAIAQAEDKMKTIHTQQEREAWEEQSEPVYKTAIADLLAVNEPKQALTVWKLLQSAQIEKPESHTRSGLLTKLAKIESSNPQTDSGGQRLTLARLDDAYVGWLTASGSTTEPRTFLLQAPPASIEMFASTLERLCSDRHSDLADIKLIGTMLDRIILLPIDPFLDPAKPLELDLDPSIEALPFAAIFHRGGFIGLERPIVYLRPVASHKVQNIAATHDDTLNTKLPMVLIRQSIVQKNLQIPEEYNETRELVQLFPSATLMPATLKQSGGAILITQSPANPINLSRAELIHYAGHGIQPEEQVSPDAGKAADKSGRKLESIQHCRIAVMAACRTGSEREFRTGYVPTLVPLLLQAGAQRVLASQWDVDSSATRRLTLNFYEQLSKAETFTEAFHHSQQSLAKNKETEHPYFWAPFQLTRASPISKEGIY